MARIASKSHVAVTELGQRVVGMVQVRSGRYLGDPRDGGPDPIAHHETVSTIERYVATADIGAPFEVVLHNSVEERVNIRNGTRKYVIPHLGTLVAVLAVIRACHPLRFSSDDVRFVRRSMCKKGVEFASMIDVSPEQLSRYENGKVPVSESKERMIRYVVVMAHFELTKSLKVVQSLNVSPEMLCSIPLKSVRLADRRLCFDLRPPFEKRITCDFRGNCDYLEWQRAV
jgi:transcriptional regulator with XRE-family HTH domain